MDALTKTQVREFVANFSKNHQSLTKSQLVSKLEEAGVAKRTPYHILKKLETRGNVEHAGKGKSGRKATKMGGEKKRRLLKAAKGKVGASLRVLARRFGVSFQYVAKILKEHNIKYRKRTKIPLVTPEQQKRQKTPIRRLSRGRFSAGRDLDVVMDDESYFTFSGTDVPANAGYYVGPDGDVPDSVRFRPVGKFPSKLLVWVAISPKGVSRPIICPSRAKIGGDFYRKECLQKGLLPFIQEHYPRGGYNFWPDLAAAHYARKTTALLEEAGVSFIAREENSPCVPQLHPIEDFWGIIKQEVYKGGWEAKSEQQLKDRIRRVLRSIGEEVPRKLMEGVPARVRRADRHGVSSAVH